MGKITALMHWLVGLALVLGLAGCASDDAQYAALPKGAASVVENQHPLQCVAYARAHSDVKLIGDAYTWWDQAAGK